MNVLALSITSAGASLAERLPWPHQQGDLVATVRKRWEDADGFLLVCATGIAVRAIGPLLDDKTTDPAVVCVDDGGRFAVVLSGGHRGANDLAREAAGLLGATAVVSTGTDVAGLPALDALPRLAVRGDVAGVTRRWLDGDAPRVDDELGWPLPPGLERGDGPHRVLLTDRAAEPGPLEVVLHPPSLVVGVGSSSDAPPSDLRALLDAALAGAGLTPASVGLVATLDRKADEPAIRDLARDLGTELRPFPSDVLAGVDVPNPSDVVRQAVGTPSVAEAAALAAAGPGGELVVAKQRSDTATVAVARRRVPEGHLAVVGVGPGEPATRTPAATAAVLAADTVVGYSAYVDLVTDLVSPRHEVVRSPIGAEEDRCRDALGRAAAGQRVALVCSGDPGVYAMASLVLELAPAMGGPPVSVVPGVTAALTSAARLGAPLGHDHASISLSDLLTPWAAIEARLRAVAEADLVVALYNPRSERRTWQLDRARDLLLEHRDPATPVGVVTDAGRPGETAVVTTLGELDTSSVTMLSTIVIGSSTTRLVAGRMVTPRGYAR